MGGVVEQTLGYTADGRLNSINPGMDSPGNQLISSATWNQDARLASFNSGGEPLASYTYDGFGQRLLKTVSSSYGNIYQYDQSGILLEETDASGAAQADYIYLNGRPLVVLNGSTLYFLHDDRLGTPQLATDSSQNTQWQASYDPFGTTTSVSGEVVQNLRLPGQYSDLETGFNHNGFRDYLPVLGRYAEPDPLGRMGSGNNLYAYVSNNPVDAIDPLGLKCGCGPQSGGQAPPNTLTYKTTDGGPHSSDWYIQWALTNNSPNGGWIVQDVKAFFTNSDGTGQNGTYTEYWEAFQIPKGGQYVYPHSWPQLSSDDRFFGNYHSVIKAEACFYEGLTLPKSFVSGSVPWSGGLRATYTNPQLPTTNVTAPVDRIWYTPVP